MYRILVVDDEPRVSTGIKNLLLGAELDISYVETALNGFEAIDYIRMDRYDLVLTDIQMSRMNGIELMETIYIEQPHLPVIVISAHEKFDFAKKSLSLGAREYLVKPVERDDLLRVVYKVLREKEIIGQASLERTRSQQTKEQEKDAEFNRRELLIELATEGELSARDKEVLANLLHNRDQSFAVAVVSIRLDLTRGGFSRQEISLRDRKLMKYAAVNILDECLAEWSGLSLNGYGSVLVSIIQLSERGTADPLINMKSQLYLIGQSIYMNLKEYLNMETTIGISEPHPDVFMLPKLVEEANEAVDWRYIHPSSKVFYFEDKQAREHISIVEWVAQVDHFVQVIKSNIDQPEQVDADAIIESLVGLGEAEELFNSYFGMLVYRLYGLLLEYGHAAGIPLQRFDPDIYFSDPAQADKIERLRAYVRDTAELLRLLLTERNQSIIARVTKFIRANYRNPALKIQDIVEEVHFSPTYLSHLFKREAGIALWDYVTDLRIEEARILLNTTDKKRYEIAYEVGYESPEHFSRMFKRCVGTSPAEYRKNRTGVSG
jgi:two-component system, response regulator YesN